MQYPQHEDSQSEAGKGLEQASFDSSDPGRLNAPNSPRKRLRAKPRGLRGTSTEAAPALTAFPGAVSGSLPRDLNQFIVPDVPGEPDAPGEKPPLPALPGEMKPPTSVGAVLTR